MSSHITSVMFSISNQKSTLFFNTLLCMHPSYSWLHDKSGSQWKTQSLCCSVVQLQWILVDIETMENKKTWTLERLRVGNWESPGQYKLSKGVLFGPVKKCVGQNKFFDIERSSLLMIEKSFFSRWSAAVVLEVQELSREVCP